MVVTGAIVVVMAAMDATAKAATAAMAATGSPVAMAATVFAVTPDFP